MCEYCKNNMEGQPLNIDWNSIELIVDNCFLYAYCDCGYRNITEINYCPMCGRKLGDKR